MTGCGVLCCGVLSFDSCLREIHLEPVGIDYQVVRSEFGCRWTRFDATCTRDVPCRCLEWRFGFQVNFTKAGPSPKTNLAPSHRRPRPCNPSRPPPTTSQSQPTSQPPLSQPTAGPARKPTASLHALPRYSALRETPCRAWEMLMRKSPIFSRASRMLR